jgi:8-oxo-dGTP pyrophosphatase MutT (NUDIX family)
VPQPSPARRTRVCLLADAAARCAYRAAYRLLRAYWWLFHPETHAALVAIWHKDQVLLIRNSYVAHYGLPGGYVRKGEAVEDAAARELAEELSLRVSPDELRLAHEETYEWGGKRDHVVIFGLDVDTPPVVSVDRREVVAAELHAPAAALALALMPPLRRYLETCMPARSR